MRWENSAVHSHRDLLRAVDVHGLGCPCYSTTTYFKTHTCLHCILYTVYIQYFHVCTSSCHAATNYNHLDLD